MIFNNRPLRGRGEVGVAVPQLFFFLAKKEKLSKRATPW